MAWICDTALACGVVEAATVPLLTFNHTFHVYKSQLPTLYACQAVGTIPSNGGDDPIETVTSLACLLQQVHCINKTSKIIQYRAIAQISLHILFIRHPLLALLGHYRLLVLAGPAIALYCPGSHNSFIFTSSPRKSTKQSPHSDSLGSLDRV